MAPAAVPSSAATIRIRSEGTRGARKRTAAMSGACCESFELAMPPPMTITSGTRTVPTLAMAIASAGPTSLRHPGIARRRRPRPRTRLQPSLDRRAGRSCRPERRPPRSRGSRSRTLGPRDRPFDGRSRRPCRSSRDGGADRMITPPPIPVPRVRPTNVRLPRPASSSASARTNARASLMIIVGSPSRCATRSRTGKPGEEPWRFVNSLIRSVSGLNRPGIPTPTVDTGPCSVAKALPAATIFAVTASGPSSATVGTLDAATTRGSLPAWISMTVSLMLVPPRSRPRCRLGLLMHIIPTGLARRAPASR